MGVKIQLFEVGAYRSDFQDIQGVSGGIVNILGVGSMDYSEQISSLKHVSNFQWVWRYSCLKLGRTDPIFKIYRVFQEE